MTDGPHLAEWHNARSDQEIAWFMQGGESYSVRREGALGVAFFVNDRTGQITVLSSDPPIEERERRLQQRIEELEVIVSAQFSVIHSMHELGLEAWLDYDAPGHHVWGSTLDDEDRVLCDMTEADATVIKEVEDS